MSSQATDWRGHALNNVLCKIVGSAELALDGVDDPDARRELDAIIQLAEQGAFLVRSLVRQTPVEIARVSMRGAQISRALGEPVQPEGR